MPEIDARCSFCEKTRENGVQLFTKANIAICNECVSVCMAILDTEVTSEDVEFIGSAVCRDLRLDGIPLVQFLGEHFAPGRSADSIAVGELIDAYHARALLLRTRRRSRLPNIQAKLDALRDAEEEQRGVNRALAAIRGEDDDPNECD